MDDTLTTGSLTRTIDGGPARNRYHATVITSSKGGNSEQTAQPFPNYGGTSGGPE